MDHSCLGTSLGYVPILRSGPNSQFPVIDRRMLPEPWLTLCSILHSAKETLRVFNYSNVEDWNSYLAHTYPHIHQHWQHSGQNTQNDNDHIFFLLHFFYKCNGQQLYEDADLCDLHTSHCSPSLQDHSCRLWSKEYAPDWCICRHIQNRFALLQTAAGSI